LEELGHPQPPTPLETDNITATGYSNGKIKQKRTKAIYMRFYWIKDRVKQGQFNVFWGPGSRNLADYFTDHHSPAHHKRMREIYIHASEQPMNRKGSRDSAFRGCVNTSGKAGAHILHLPWEMNHLPWEIEQQAYSLIQITRLCVTSHSQPLINAQHQMARKKLIVNNNK
jgi:hypothetical protein